MVQPEHQLKTLNSNLLNFRTIVELGGAGTLVRGHGLGVFYSHTLKAAERLDRREEVREQIRTVVVARKGFVAQVLGRELGLPTPQKGLPAPHCSCR